MCETEFKENMDAWIKQIRSETTDASSLLKEVISNTQHNYELIYELKDDIEKLKQDIQAIKLIQIVSLKKNNLA